MGWFCEFIFEMIEVLISDTRLILRKGAVMPAFDVVVGPRSALVDTP